MRFASVCLMAAAIFASQPVAAALQLEPLLSAPLPLAPLAFDQGKALAWLEHEPGAHSVWIARAPHWAPRRLHSFPGDDGLELGELAVSHDGRWLAFVRGGDEGGSPETNTASDPAGAKATVWLVSIAGGGDAHAVGEGGSPAFSTKGDTLVYVQSDQLWSVPTAGRSKPRQLTHLRGKLGAPRWSPDGSRVAFVVDRDTHRFVGVLDPGASRITWLDPGVDTDGDPTWSPDGREVAFIRTPADASPPSFVPRRSALTPWSIRVADAATGAGRELFRADAGVGSVFHELDTNPRDLWWTADGRIVFPWERSGWLHLYSMPAGGGAPTELTPGSYEIEHVTIASDQHTIVLTSNELGLDGRTLWRIAGAGSTRERLDDGEAKYEFFPAPLADGAVAYLETAARQPVTLVVRDRAGAELALRGGALAEAFPASELVEPTNVLFPSTDGLQIHGQLFLPPGASADARVPAVVFVHGGPVRQMFAAPHFWGYYQGAYLLNQLLASRGIAVLSVNYRAGIGYGLAFREADGIGEDGASEFNDVLGGALYLKSRPEIDGERIGIWGGSYGGYLTALALARASRVFKAGVDYHGVHDWNVEFPNPPFTRTYIETGERLARAFRASPMADIASWRSPVLLIQGDDDHNVPFAETIRLAEALRGQQVEFEMLVFPDETHDFHRRGTWLRAYGATVEFLTRKLGAGGG